MEIFKKENEPFANRNEKNNVMMIRAINFSLISSHNNKILGINRLNNVINTHLLKDKISIYVNLIAYYYDIKDNDNYMNIRKL